VKYFLKFRHAGYGIYQKKEKRRQRTDKLEVFIVGGLVIIAFLGLVYAAILLIKETL